MHATVGLRWWNERLTRMPRPPGAPAGLRPPSGICAPSLNPRRRAVPPRHPEANWRHVARRSPRSSPASTRAGAGASRSSCSFRRAGDGDPGPPSCMPLRLGVEHGGDARRSASRMGCRASRPRPRQVQGFRALWPGRSHLTPSAVRPAVASVGWCRNWQLARVMSRKAGHPASADPDHVDHLRRVSVQMAGDSRHGRLTRAVVMEVSASGRQVLACSRASGRDRRRRGGARAMVAASATRAAMVP